LGEHASNVKQAARATEKGRKKAADLLQALDQLEGLDRWDLVEQLGIAEGLTLLEAVRNEFNKRRLGGWRGITATISAAAAQPLYKPGRGQPRNIVAELVLQDLAALFEYVTGLRATRRVDRTGEKAGKETGPFLNFAKAVWPVIFGSDVGLLSQLREWDVYGGKKSMVISAIALRRPEWGVSGHRSAIRVHGRGHICAPMSGASCIAVRRT
jgi:hypothetical protein